MALESPKSLDSECAVVIIVMKQNYDTLRNKKFSERVFFNDGFLSTLNLMGFLAVLIVIGYCLTKFKLVPDNSTEVLSKLEK